MPPEPSRSLAHLAWLGVALMLLVGCSGQSGTHPRDIELVVHRVVPALYTLNKDGYDVTLSADQIDRFPGLTRGELLVETIDVHLTIRSGLETPILLSSGDVLGLLAHDTEWTDSDGRQWMFTSTVRTIAEPTQIFDLPLVENGRRADTLHMGLYQLVPKDSPTAQPVTFPTLMRYRIAPEASVAGRVVAGQTLSPITEFPVRGQGQCIVGTADLR